jgi:hypothetical protein
MKSNLQYLKFRHRFSALQINHMVKFKKSTRKSNPIRKSENCHLTCCSSRTPIPESMLQMSLEGAPPKGAPPPTEGGAPTACYPLQAKTLAVMEKRERGVEGMRNRSLTGERSRG